MVVIAPSIRVMPMMTDADMALRFADPDMIDRIGVMSVPAAVASWVA